MLGRGRKRRVRSLSEKKEGDTLHSVHRGQGDTRRKVKGRRANSRRRTRGGSRTPARAGRERKEHVSDYYDLSRGNQSKRSGRTTMVPGGKE